MNEGHREDPEIFGNKEDELTREDEIDRIRKRALNSVISLNHIFLPIAGYRGAVRLRSEMLVAELMTNKSSDSNVHLDIEWSNFIMKHVREVYNSPVLYGRILQSLLACFDHEGRIPDVIDNFEKKMTNDLSRKKYALSAEKNSLVHELFQSLRELRILDGKEILEIGGRGLKEVFEGTPSGQPQKYDYFSTGVHEGKYSGKSENTSMHITSKNYESIVGHKQQYDAIVTRRVFEPGSGIEAVHKNYEEGQADLLKACALLTKPSGFNIHEQGLRLPEKFINDSGFEILFIIDTTEGVLPRHSAAEFPAESEYQAGQRKKQIYNSENHVVKLGEPSSWSSDYLYILRRI